MLLHTRLVMRINKLKRFLRTVWNPERYNRLSRSLAILRERVRERRI